MAVRKEKVRINEIDLYKVWSDNYMKIQCEQDMNIYQVAYISLNSPSTFTETSIPVDSIKTVDASQIVGIDAKVLEVIRDNNEYVADVLDGVEDDVIHINQNANID